MSQYNLAIYFKISQPLIYIYNYIFFGLAEMAKLKTWKLGTTKSVVEKRGKVERAWKLWFIEAWGQDAHIDGCLMQQNAAELLRIWGKNFFLQ